ncbi:hypothetical protein [Paenibacillus montanisoli]|nr:hypothetical protein [Paenibacillus montanisoli]
MEVVMFMLMGFNVVVIAVLGILVKGAFNMGIIDKTHPIRLVKH